MIKLIENNSSAGISEFQWSTSEQVWPFEKASDGSTLYCKQIDCGRMPNNGNSQTAHNVSFSSLYKLHRYEYLVRNTNGFAFFAKDNSGAHLNNYIWTYVDPTVILVETSASWMYNANLYFLARIIYAK